eukprot:SAG31_NODE_613_length_13545_cov_10.972557_14_plen_40_part_00
MLLHVDHEQERSLRRLGEAKLRVEAAKWCAAVYFHYLLD